MPEGDTVFLAASRLHSALGGRVITGSDFRIPDLATADVTGRKVERVRPRGKHLFFELEDVVLHTHFRIEGTWHLYRARERWRGPDFQVRAVLRTEPWVAVGFRLPVIELLDPAQAEGRVAHLGPDLLGPDWDAEEAVSRLLSEPDRPIGEALLDQRNLAGLGNVYRAEICFLRGLEPSTPVGRVTDLPALVALAKRLMDANKGTGNQVTTGVDRPGESRWVYGRARAACRRCRTPIESYEDSSGRVVYLCPPCQPPPDR